MDASDDFEWFKPIVIGDNDVRTFEKDAHLYPPEYEGHFDGLVLTNTEIRNRVTQLATLIHADCKGTRPVLVCTLKGACPFFTHLTDALQELRQGYDMEFVRMSSYEGTESTGHVQVVGELQVARLKDRNIVLIEDIVDTGTTLSALVPMLMEQRSPTSVSVCTLLDKRLADTEKKFQAKYVGFSIPEKFIIGYGLDYNELYRDLKDIFVISEKGIEVGKLRN